MKSKILLFILITLNSCSQRKSNTNDLDKHNQISQNSIEDSPYKTFFDQLKIDELTDTVLIQRKTKIFYCGTGYFEYKKELNSKGLNKFYEKHGTVLSNLEFINLFKNNHNVKILWINRGNEGELFQLEDSLLHKNSKLEKRLISEKTFLHFDDNPKSLHSLTITLLIEHKKTNQTILKSFDISANKNEWTIDKAYEKELENRL